MQAIATTPVQRVLTENPISLDSAGDVIAEITGRKPDRTTVYRWCLRGVGGVKLDHARVASVIVTSVPAINRFIEARTNSN